MIGLGARFARTCVGLVTVVTAATLLAGCAMIPRSGDVHEGVAASITDSDPIQFLPSGPVEGASPEAILRGFVDAATSPRDDWGIAREFLTRTFTTVWKPTAGVSVDLGNRNYTVANQTNESAEFVLETTVAARVDANGNYANIEATPTALSFGFTLEDGQWRISSAPAGVLLDQTTFGQVFASAPLFFFDPNFEHLVPDVRWFPARVSTSTRVVKALLAGPAGWLTQAGAVASVIPESAVLVADTVPVQNGTATVNFDIKSLQVDSLTSSRMLRQLSASLAQVFGVERVDMQFSGTSEGGVPVPAMSSLIAPSQVTEPLVDTADAFGIYQAGTVAPMARIGATIHALSPQAVSVRMDLGVAAVLTSAGVVVVSGDGVTRNVDARAGLLAPTLDTRGYVWSVPRDAPTAVHATSLDGVIAQVSIPWAQAQSIASLAVSPDGTRVAVALTYGGRAHICVAGITRSSEGIPLALGPCLEPYIAIDDVHTLGWADAARIALVAIPRAASNPTTYLLTVGGRVDTLSAFGDATAISGTGPAAVVRSSTQTGNLYEQVSVARWLLISSGIRVLATVQ